MAQPLIVIPNYITQPADLEVLRDMLTSLRATQPEAEVLVVDDCSPASELIDELEGDTSRLRFELVRQPTNEGFSTTVNVGLRRALAEGRDAVLANADLEFIEPGWLDRMIAADVAVVGGLLLYPSGIIQHAGVFFSMLHRTFGHIYQYAPQDLPEAQLRRRCPVTGALQYIQHECLAEVGVYDEGFRMGFEDVDYCIRTFLSGRSCLYEPAVRAYHYESLFRGRRGDKLEKWQNASWGHFVQKYATQSFAEWVPSLV